MKSYRPLLLALPCAMSLAVTEANAAVLIYDDFSGNNADNVNGTTPDTNIYNANTWQADSINYLRADGSLLDEAGDSNNVDRGAFLHVGTGIFATNTTYTVTLDFGQLEQSAIFLGFSDVSTPDPITNLTDSTAQTKGSNNFAIRVREFTNDQDVAIWNRVGGANSQTIVNATMSDFNDASYVVSMTINSNSLTDAEVTINYGGSEQTVNADLSGMQYFYYGVEDADLSSAQGTMGVVNSVTFASVPEPTTATMGFLGLACMLFRRRRN
ncbi:PEP-CTERM sorting domain-containing protein [Rubritalea squalenifaciens]|nr:PEP-CTERM sorting domain-containing protein [Rubritalea squalenifaciens]